MPEFDFLTALDRLDEDIAQLEAQLSEIKLRRKGLAWFIDRYMHSKPPNEQRTKPTLIDSVVEVFRQHPYMNLGVEDVKNHLLHNGVDASHSSVRNAIYYALRVGKIHHVPERRGVFSFWEMK